MAARGRTARVEAVVRGVPRPLSGSAAPGSVLAHLRVTRVASPTQLGPQARAGGPVSVLGDASWARLRPGTRVVATLRLQPRWRLSSDVASGVVRGPPTVLGGPTGLLRVTGRVRAGLARVSAPLGQPAAGLLPAIVHGDTSAVPPQLAEQFRISGLAHLEAVSGANVAIVVRATAGVAGALGAGRRTVALVGTLAVVAFAVLADLSPPVVRASATGVLVLLGGRAAPGRGPALLCTAVTVLLLADPWLAVDLGFALSVTATVGILAAAPRLSAALGSWLPGPVAAAAGLGLAAQAACQPLLSAAFGQVGLVAPFTNIAAEPAVAVATLAGLAAAVLAALPGTGPLGHLLGAGAVAAAHVGGWACRWLALVARTGANAPGAGADWGAGTPGMLLAILAGATFLIVGPALVRRRRPALAAAGVLTGLVIGPVLLR